jgi:hypothetical protein
VNVADIKLAADANNLATLNSLTYNTDYAIWAYDIQKRAAEGKVDDNWIDVTELKAGVAYMIYIDSEEVGSDTDATLVFPANSKATIDKIYPTTSTINASNLKGTETVSDYKDAENVVFHKNAATGLDEWGWNFVGSNRTATYTLLPEHTSYDVEGGSIDKQITFLYAYIPNAKGEGDGVYDYVELENGVGANLSPYAGYFIQVGGEDAEDITEGSHAISLYWKHSGLTHTTDNIYRSSNVPTNLVELSLQGEGSTSSDKLSVRKSDRYSNKYSLGEDAPKLFNHSAPAEFYTLLGNTPMRANKYQSIDSDIPVGLRVYQEGTYTISLSDFSGFDEDIYLIDKDANQIQNLAQGDYVFNASASTDDRLFLHFGSVTGIQTPTSKISVRVENNTAYVKNIKVGDQVSIYNISGQVISRGVATSSEQSYPLAGTGAYVVKVTGSESYVSKILNK